MPEWAKQSTKPTYTADEIGAISKGANISELTNDVGYLTEHQSLADYALKKEIPTKVSELENDSKYLTTHQDISGKVDKVQGKGLSTNDYTNEAKAKVDNIPLNPKYTDTVYDDSIILNDIETLKNKNTFDNLIIDSSLQIGNTIVNETEIQNLYDNTDGELIVLADIEVEEDCVSVDIKTFPDGSALKLQYAYYEATIPASTINGKFGISSYYSNKIIGYSVSDGMSTTVTKYSNGAIFKKNGIWMCYGCQITTQELWAVNNVNISALASSTTTMPYITRVVIKQLNNGTIKAGAKIKVWGIKARD